MSEARVVDIHSHFGCAEALDLAAPHRKADSEPYLYYLGEDSKQRSATLSAAAPVLESPSDRLDQMDQMGVDLQGLSTRITGYCYWAPARVGRDAARMQNDRLAEAAAEFPNRFVVVGATVPMQDVDLAIAEMDRAIDELGAKGIQIGGTVDGRNLDEPRFRPFWQAAAAKGVPVILHPFGFPESNRFGDYFLVNSIGAPLETMTAATRMIFSGLLEELPTLKLVLMHGGGYLPFYAGRSDHAWRVRPEARVNIPDHPPSYYLRKLWYDSLVYDPAYLRFLIDIVGSDRVMLGTDYPFDMAESEPLTRIDAVTGLTLTEREAVKGRTALALFDID